MTASSMRAWPSANSREIADGLATLQHGLDLFPEDQVLREMKDQAKARGLLN